ncbi:hypothetical protein [Bradyrhizobium archetypum]|nr:hypothetical protein [Bradyrhizobium archetypum]
MARLLQCHLKDEAIALTVTEEPINFGDLPAEIDAVLQQGVIA